MSPHPEIPRDPDDRQGIRFDKTINLGHVLTFIGFMLSIMVIWGTLDKRVVVLEEARRNQEARDTAQDQRLSEKMSEIKESLSEIKRSVEGVRAKLEKDR